MARTVAFHYHLPPDATWQDAARLQRWMTEMARIGYYLQDVPVAGASPLARGVTMPGIASSLTHAAQQFGAKATSTLWVHAAPCTADPALNSMQGGIAFRTQARVGMVAMTLATNPFAQPPAARQAMRDHWLNLFLVLPTVWDVQYAHSYQPAAPWPEPDDADLDAGRLAYLYDLNYLGRALVARFGQEHVLATPAWRVQVLPQGGALLVPQPPLDEQDMQQWQGTMAHLGMREQFGDLLAGRVEV